MKCSLTNRMARILHAMAAFLIVGAAYLAYAAVVVPWVEPERTEAEPQGSFDDPSLELFAPESKYAALFEAILPSNHWTRTSPPKVIEFEQGMFVFLDYKTQDPKGTLRNNGHFAIEQCVMIYFPTPWSRGEGPPPADCVTLEAPQGGVVELDRPLKFFQDEWPRLKNAWLTGPVVIKSDMDSPGPEDDLEVTTRDVVINERRIWSDAAVEMRFGPHFGSGRTLEVRFLAGASGNRPNTPHVEGIQWVQLLHDVRLVLQPDERTSRFAPGMSEETADIKSESMGQIELMCSGPLFVDVPRRAAELDRDVEVFFVHKGGPSDRLACDNLEVEFANRPEEAAESDRAAFEPVRFIASGQPVTVTSTLRQFYSRSNRLVYDVKKQQLTFEASSQDKDSEGSLSAGRPAGPVADLDQACDLQFQQHRLIAPRIEYTWDHQNPRGRLGTLRVSGAGRLLSAGMGGGASQQVTATWKEGLQLIRKDNEPVLSLFGRPEIEGADIGRLAAHELHVWLREAARIPVVGNAMPVRPSPDADQLDIKIDVVPDRLFAKGDVEIDAPQLTARVGQLEAWLVSEGGDDSGPLADHGTKEASGLRQNMFDPNSGALAPDKAYYVECDLLQIRAIPRDRINGRLPDADVTHLTLVGAVLFEERPAQQQQLPSVRVEADRLEAADLHTSSMYVSAVGKPVVVHANGTRLRGGEVRYDQATNVFDVPAAGDLSLTIDQDLDGRPLEDPLPITVSWKGGLHFDGKEAVLTDAVHVSTPDERLQTQKLTATLGASVPLDRLQGNGRVDFERLQCTGGVILDRRTSDAGGVVAQEHAEIPNLTIEQRQNRIFATGPGWLRSVSLGQGNVLRQSPPAGSSDSFTGHAMRQQASRPSGGAAPFAGRLIADTQSSHLTYLRVDFQQAMHGNHRTRDVTFEGQVQCIRGPVASWDQTVRIDGLAQLPADTFALNTTALRVGQRRAEGSQWHELEAVGNVEIEGGLGENGIFVARGARLTYDERKDLLILDGGAGMAELVHEKSIGGNSYQMRQRAIHVSPHRKYVHSSGFSHSSGGL